MAKYKVGDYIIVQQGAEMYQDPDNIFLDVITEVNDKRYTFNQRYCISGLTDEIDEHLVYAVDETIESYEAKSRLATPMEVLLYG